MRYLIRILAVVVLFLGGGIFVGCDSSIFYDEHKFIENDIWNIDDKKVFDVKVDNDDMADRYNFLIDLRNTKEYPYSNAFLFIKTTFPNGGYALDTMECPLTETSGKWYGKVSANHVDNRFYLRKDVVFPQEGMYRFEIFHGLRDTNVEGIKNVGLRIERVQ